MSLRRNLEKIWEKIEKDEPASWVSQKMEAGSPDEVAAGTLTRANHAFYLGVMPKIRPDMRFFIMLGFEDVPTYTAELVAGMLDFADYASSDSPMVFKLGGRLSWYCNGRDSMDGMMSMQEQENLIRKLAGDREIIISEHLDDHPELRSALDDAFDKKAGVIDVEKIFGTTMPLPEEGQPNALQIAHCIYNAAKNNMSFRQEIINLRTRKTRGDSDELTASACYGIFEIAMRLTDTLRGCTYQGGIERQDRYDSILTRIMRGNYKKLGGLRPLSEIFEGKQFRSMHLKYKASYQERRACQIRLRTRYAIFAVTGAVITIAPPAFIYEEMSRQQAVLEERNQELLGKQLENRRFFMSGPPIMFDPENNVYIFEDICNEARQIFSHRYGLNDSEIDRVFPTFQQFLIKLQDISYIKDESERLARMVDLFVLENEMVFVNLGINIGKPYARMREYDDYLLEAAARRDEIDSATDITYCEKPYEGTSLFMGGNLRDYREEEIETWHIGSVASLNSNYILYDFLIYKKDGQETLLAYFGSQDEPKNNRCYSEWSGAQGAWSYVVAMRQSAIAGISDSETEKLWQRYIPDSTRLWTVDYSFAPDEITSDNNIVHADYICYSNTANPLAVYLPEARNEEGDIEFSYASESGESVTFSRTTAKADTLPMTLDFTELDGDIHSKLPRFVDPFGEYEYDLIVVHPWELHWGDPTADDFGFQSVIAAKAPGDSEYSMARGREAAEHYWAARWGSSTTRTNDALWLKKAPANSSQKSAASSEQAADCESEPQ